MHRKNQVKSISEEIVSLIEYRGYHISISAREQSWGFSFGEWSGVYRIWQKGSADPIQGTMDESAPSAYEAEKKALHMVKIAIDDAIFQSAQHLRSALKKPELQVATDVY